MIVPPIPTDSRYVEQREFLLRLELRCPFPDDYDGDDDGYVWLESFRPLAAEIVQAVAAVVARRPGWRVRPANRGRPTEDEVTLVLERQLGGDQGGDQGDRRDP